jgi:hypothetical protein
MGDSGATEDPIMLTKQMKIGPCEQVTDNIPIHFREKPTFRPTVSGHRLLELTTVTLKNEASAIQEYSFA